MRKPGVMVGMRVEDPKLLARLAGVFFLLTIVGGISAQSGISERLVNFGDAAATAKNILANRGLFQIGFTVYLIEMACQVTTVALLYRLLRPVNGTLALLMLLMEMTGIVIKTFSRVFFLTPLWVLDSGAAMTGMDGAQLQSLSLMLLKVNDFGAAAALAFFGFSTILDGYLVFRSTFLPKWLGIVGMVVGFGWLAFIYPPLGYSLFMITALVGLLAAAAKIFWLIVFGVDEEKFRAVEALR
jgi:hypothetical protein